jgi:hypothetical protein
MADNLDWREQAIHDYENSDDTVEVIAARYGRHWSTLNKLLIERRKAGLGRARAAKRRVFSERSVLSTAHRQIGIRMNMFRTLGMDWSMEKLASKLNVSRIRIVEMERGLHDFTLTELQAISDLVDLPLERLGLPIGETTQWAKDLIGKGSMRG